MDIDKPLIFVSCGQRSEEEKSLGRDICALIDDTTPFRAYFAEYQTSLEGLTTNILSALDKAAGIITVMHHRGSVTYPQRQELIRASVWVEQEIAIAAFIRQIMGRDIEVKLYVQHGIELEGMRKYLIMNPISFDRGDEIIKDLKKELAIWCENIKLPELFLDFVAQKRTSERHDYALLMTVQNTGKGIMDDYHVDVEFPAMLALEDGGGTRVEGRCSKTHVFHRFSLETMGQRVLYPGDSLRQTVLHYFVDNDIYMNRNVIFELPITATLFSGGKKIRAITKPLKEFQDF